MSPIRLYRESDQAAARLLIERLGKLHGDRLAMEAISNHRAAVRDSKLIQDLLETATAEQLRAAVVQLTTPELRPALPVVIAPTPTTSRNDELEQAYRDSPGFRERGL